MKIVTIVNDLTGAKIENPIRVSIEKEGHMIEYPEGCFTNRIILDIEESDFPKLVGKMRFRPIDQTPIKTVEVR